MSKQILILFSILVNSIALSQTQTAITGQTSQIKFNIANVVNTNKCNIEVTLPNQQKVGVEVEGPQFIASVEFTPVQIGSNAIAWEGKTKVRGLATVFACPGSGIIQVQVTGDTEDVAQKWNQYFSKVTDEIRDCVKVGMDLSQLKYQLLSDPNTVLTSPSDSKLKPIYEKCDNFAKQNQPKKLTPCTIPNLNNLKTLCDGAYVEKQTDGKLKAISRNAAIQMHFEGKPWSVAYSENLDTKATRLKQEEEEKVKQAASTAAQKEADEKERKFKESPDYKKQQAELERKKIAEEKETARKQAESEKIRISEEKQTALKAKKEQEEKDRQIAAIEKDTKQKSQKELPSNQVTQEVLPDKRRRSVSGKPQDEAFCSMLGDTRIHDKKCISEDPQNHAIKIQVSYQIRYQFVVPGITDRLQCNSINLSRPLLNFLESKKIKYELNLYRTECNYDFVVDTKQDLCSQEGRVLSNSMGMYIKRFELTKAGNSTYFKTSYSEECNY